MTDLDKGIRDYLSAEDAKLLYRLAGNQALRP